ncbi:MAG TPA: hypothetical protein VE967_07605 [Gemmatimonadaceae bacterium]|nr:hypothetical protein [Gemmatimonadaceae bacterium]
MPRRPVTRIAIYATLFALALACGSDGTAPHSKPGQIRVLFIGNSLTYTNSLPQMVDALAAASGFDIVSDAQASPDYALIDHWDNPQTRQRVQTGHYDVVILQQGPSSLSVNRDSLRLWTAMWAPVIRTAGGRPALYAVWPEAERSYAFGDVSTSYRLAAEDVNGLFFPVGDTWLETWAEYPTAELYGADNFHPAVAGTYAAAVVIVSILTHSSPTSLATTFQMPPTVSGALDATVAQAIRGAAAVVIARTQTSY